MRDPEALIEADRDEAKRKAFEALARYKFQMFGYWAAIWVHLNRLARRRSPNPFRGLVASARATIEIRRAYLKRGVANG